MLRSAILILSGNSAQAGLLFARNLALAALIPVADYGIAATLVVAIAAVEMASAFGVHQQLVQARDGDDPRLQDALQGFQLFRGILAAMLMIALAWPLAWFFDLPQVAWGYAALALVPLCNALQHLDMHRFNRDGRFGALIAAQTGPAAVSLLLIWPLAWWLGDWRVMLGALIAYAALAALASHLLAERPFRPAFDRGLWTRIFGFGWPILADAGLLFLVMQGDKMIVGRLEGMAVLSAFALAVTLTLTPALVVARTVQTGALPRLSRLSEAPDAFARAARRTLWLTLAAGLTLGMAGILAAPVLAWALAGTDWTLLAVLIAPMAVLQGLRLAKVGSITAALALGRTRNAVASNIPRVVALALGWMLLAGGADLLWLIWLGCAAEAIGAAISVLLLARAAGTAPPLRPLAAGAVGFAALAVAAAVIS